jgi:hypothetical protein
MYSCANDTLVSDRFNNPQSALYLNNGYCTVPPGVYFNGGPFTILAWVKVIQILNHNRLLDFGNGPESNNLIVSLSMATTSEPCMGSLLNSVWTGVAVASSPIDLGVWTHLASVFDGSQAYIYVNGTQSGVQPMTGVDNNIRNNCFFGRSNWHDISDPDTNAILDDIKIYNRALSSQEIAQDMNSTIF